MVNLAKMANLAKMVIMEKKITIDDALIYKQILLRNSLRKSMEISLKNLYLNIGA